MGFMPKSRTARRRLLVVSVAAGVLLVAGALAVIGVGNGVSMFYTPTQAAQANQAKPLAGRNIQLGGFVKPGSVVKSPDGNVAFVVTDCTHTQVTVSYKGDLPDLFREGQGVVTKGAFIPAGGFTATEVLAKHDERYMPRDLTNQLKKSGASSPMGGKAGTMAYETACGAKPA
jgi:cytochrome c-type biogenesis protein CcmE